MKNSFQWALRRFDVNGGDGYLQVNMEGSVTLGHKYQDTIILRFDVAEYLKYYGLAAMPEAVDIIDVGYWYLVEGCMEGYEPPVEDMRQKKVTVTFTRDTAYDIAGLISQTLIHPPKVSYYGPERRLGLQAAYRDLMQEANNIEGPRV